jgi:cold shock CspA family protein
VTEPLDGQVDGRVTAFDDGRGRGVVTAADGRQYTFHATRIADGTRRIAVGAAVRFTVVPAMLGQWEASGITRV